LTGLTGFLGLFFFSSFQMKLEKLNPPSAENYFFYKYPVPVCIFIVPVNLLKFMSLFTLAAGDWGLDALIRRAAKRKNPINPVNPV
jgi:hypothetical protein